MCRWLAFTGGPIDVADLVVGGTNSIVQQSLLSHEGAEPTNGDGFGVGWWAHGASAPSRYRSTEPAWNDANLAEITGELSSRMVIMHVRAAIGSPVQLTNCHPFRQGNLLFAHNGYVDGFHDVRRQLLMDLETDRFNDVHGTTDSEVLFQLALGYGLEDDPHAALERAVGHVEQVLERSGREPLLQLSICVGDGDSLHAIRYATSGTPRTLYTSRSVAEIAERYPELPAVRVLSPDSRLVVSEPLVDKPGIWDLVEPSTYLRVHGGEVEHASFEPRVTTGASA